MFQIWLYSLISVLVVSLISLIGIVALAMNPEKLKRILIYLVSFATGGLFGGAFIHLLPEAAEKNGFTLEVSLYVLIGIISAFIIEKFICWRHCHQPTTKDHPHPFAIMNLVGDCVHNFIDGLIIGGSYLVSIQVGIATTLAVVLHEVPQEIGDFGILLHGGFTRKKALFLNFITALTAVLGVIFSLSFASTGNIAGFLVPFAAGNFIYIAGSDLIPELKKDFTFGKSFFQLLAILLGIALMLILAFLNVN